MVNKMFNCQVIAQYLGCLVATLMGLMVLIIVVWVIRQAIECLIEWLQESRKEKD